MYRIVDWAAHFENNRTRELKKLEWVPFPNRHDGDGYTELLDHPSGPAHYAVWVGIVQVASKCDPRGTLSRDGARPHDAASLGRMIRMPASLVAEAIERLIEPVRWLEVVPDPEPYQQLAEIPQEGATAPQEGASRVRAQEGNGREWNGTEGKGNTLSPDGEGGSEKCELTWDELVSAWNSTSGVTACRSRTAKRLKALQTRLKEPGWAAALRDALKKFPLRCFANDQNGWKPDIEWILGPDAVTKVLEGKYDWEKKPDKQQSLLSSRVGPGQRYTPDE